MSVFDLLVLRRWVLPLETACCLPTEIAEKRAQICHYAQLLEEVILSISQSAGVPLDSRRWNEWPYETASAFVQWITAVHHDMVLQLFPLRTYHPDLMQLTDHFDIVGSRYSPSNVRSLGMPYFFFRPFVQMCLPPTSAAEHVVRMELAGAAIQDALVCLMEADLLCRQVRALGGVARAPRTCLLRNVPVWRLSLNGTFPGQPAQLIQDNVPTLWRALLAAWPPSFRLPPICGQDQHRFVHSQLEAITRILRAMRKALLSMEPAACHIEVSKAVALLDATRFEDTDYLRLLLRPVVPYRNGRRIFFPSQDADASEDMQLNGVMKAFQLRMLAANRLGLITLHIDAIRSLYRTSAFLLAVSKEYRIW